MVKLPDAQTYFNKYKLISFPQPDIVQLHHPVLLCHGYAAIAGLITPSPLQDPCMILRTHGVIAFAPNIVPYARIETRAEEWIKRMKELKAQYGFEKFNVVAHSMGGLDMRYALNRLGAEEHIASLLTIASPHQGSPLANFVLNTPGKVKEQLGSFFDWLGDRLYPSEKSDSVAAVEQLTPEYLTSEFNPVITDHPDVVYLSYSAAVGKGTKAPLNPIYRFQNHYIFEREGKNDAFVSVESSKWGEHLDVKPISHLEQMGIRVVSDRKPLVRTFWLELARELASRGL